MANGGQIFQRTRTEFGHAQLHHQGNIPGKFRKKSDQWSLRRCDNEKLFTHVGVDGWMPDSPPCGISSTAKKLTVFYEKKKQISPTANFQFFYCCDLEN